MKTKQKPLPPLKAIRKHCLDCVGDCREDVRTCTGTNCFLWPFRFGTNPNRKELTEAERKKKAARLGRKRKDV